MRRLSLIATAVAAVLPLWISPAQAAFPGANGLLAVQPRTGGGIVLVGADGRRAGRICTDRSQCGVPQRPRWSPDGRAIVFAGSAIKIVYPDGSCMNCQFGAAQNPAFEPGGTLISFIQQGGVSVDAIDGIRQPSSPVEAGADAVWSARRALAVVRGRAIWAGRPRHLRRLVAGSEPSWSPSGRLIAAVRGGWVVTVRVRDRQVRRLVRGTAPAFSPDGRLIAYVAPDHRLMVVSATGRSVPRRVGGIRAVSVDWQPRSRGANPGCVAPPGSRVIARSSDAVVTVDGATTAPALPYMGCRRADGRERLIERIVGNSDEGASYVRSVEFAVPYVGLVIDSWDHTGVSGSTVKVFDLRRGIMTKLGGESTNCSGPCPGPGLVLVLLGHDGVSAAHIETVNAVGSQSIPIEHVACPAGGTVCLAADRNGQLLTSTDPAAGGTGWRSGLVPEGVFGIGCPSGSLCVGVGGRISTTTNPSGGAQAWTSVPLPAGDLFADDVACPSSSLCVASRVDGSVLASSNPTGGTGAWSAAAIDTGAALGAVFCSTLPVCFVIDSSERVFTSTDPTGGASAWTRSTRTPAFLSGTCPAATLCVAVNGTHVLTSSDPGAEVWTQTSVPDYLSGIACPATSLCLAVGNNGALETSTDPAAGAWTRTTIDQGRPLTSIACASTSLCVAADSTGHVATSTDPAGGPSTWMPALIDGDPCTDTTPCSEESIQTSDATGIHTVDTSKLPGNGPFLTNLALTGDVLSWSHAGTPTSVTLARPR